MVSKTGLFLQKKRLQHSQLNQNKEHLPLQAGEGVFLTVTTTGVAKPLVPQRLNRSSSYTKLAQYLTPAY